MSSDEVTEKIEVYVEQEPDFRSLYHVMNPEALPEKWLCSAYNTRYRSPGHLPFIDGQVRAQVVALNPDRALVIVTDDKGGRVRDPDGKLRVEVVFGDCSMRPFV